MTGIQATEMPNKTTTKLRPTKTISTGEALFRTNLQMSMVKIVDAELKIDVREDINAASMTASMRPLSTECKKMDPVNGIWK